MWAPSARSYGSRLDKICASRRSSATPAAVKKTILTYGAISGIIIIGSIILGTYYAGQADQPRFSHLAGYLIMIVALSCIFVGVKRYRDHELGGVIRFGTAFLLGLGITAVASAVYVAAWEVNLSLTDYAFAEDYVESVIADKAAAGVQGADLEAEVAKMENFKRQYANPMFRVPVTFLEIFPVGLLIALISAAVLRNSKILPARD